MNKRLIPIVWWCLLAGLAGGVLGYLKGENHALISEFKVYSGNLIYVTHFAQGRHSDELKDFLKARYYYLGNRIPRSYLQRAARDYGQVGTNTMEGLFIGKGPTTGQEEYRLFREKGLIQEQP